MFNGNRERFRDSFLSRDSAVYDLWLRRGLYRNVHDVIGAQVPDSAELRVIRTVRELDQFYETYSLHRA